MFDVGLAELFLLALIGLLVLGPERLPRVANNIGMFIRKARLSWISLRNTIQSALAEADLSTPIKQAGEDLKKISKELTDMTAAKPAGDKTVDSGSAKPSSEEPAPATQRKENDD